MPRAVEVTSGGMPGWSAKPPLVGSKQLWMNRTQAGRSRGSPPKYLRARDAARLARRLDRAAPFGELLPARVVLLPGVEVVRMAMNNDELKGKVDQIKGRAKQAAGDLTDDQRLHDEGAADEAGGELREGVGKARRKVGEAIKDVGDAIKR